MQNIIITWESSCQNGILAERLARHWEYDDFVNFRYDILGKINHEMAEHIVEDLELWKKWIKVNDIVYRKPEKLLEIVWADTYLRIEAYLGQNIHFEHKTVMAASSTLTLSSDTRKQLRENWNLINIVNKNKNIVYKILKSEEIVEARRRFSELSSDIDFYISEYIPKEDLSLIDFSNEEWLKEFRNLMISYFITFFLENKLYQSFR